MRYTLRHDESMASLSALGKAHRGETPNLTSPEPNTTLPQADSSTTALNQALYLHELAARSNAGVAGPEATVGITTSLTTAVSTRRTLILPDDTYDSTRRTLILLDGDGPYCLYAQFGARDFYEGYIVRGATAARARAAHRSLWRQELAMDVHHLKRVPQRPAKETDCERD